MTDTIFGKIARGELDVDFVYEDDACVAFNDNAPQAPVHILVIPRHGFEDVTEPDAATLGHLLQVAARIGRERCPGGFRLVTNIGPEGGQTVQHLHIHILGGRPMHWPPG